MGEEEKQEERSNASKGGQRAKEMLGTDCAPWDNKH